jgi:hypothetical protein
VSSPSGPAAFNRTLHGGGFFNGLRRARGRDSLARGIGAYRCYRLPCRGPDKAKGMAVALPFARTPSRGGKLVGESLVGLQWSPGVFGFGESTAALAQAARSKVAMRRTHAPDLDYDLALRLAR